MVIYPSVLISCWRHLVSVSIRDHRSGLYYKVIACELGCEVEQLYEKHGLVLIRLPLLLLRSVEM